MRRFFAVLGLLSVLVAVPVSGAVADPTGGPQNGHCAVC